MKSKNPFLHKVKIQWDVFDEDSDDNPLNWCYEQFGRGGYQKGSRWSMDRALVDHVTCYKNTTFRFRHENDEVLFMLRWL